MKVVVIGGSGHVGTYLVPRLVAAGHEVVNVSRGGRQPYQPHAAWSRVQSVTVDRGAAEAGGSFGAAIAALAPDAVIDMICFTEASGRQLAGALAGRVQHLLVCGTIWVHGPSREVPTTEAEPRRPFGDYGVNKAALEAYLLREARLHGLPATVLHPGHIVGPGWVPLNPAGHFDAEVYGRLARGEEVALPNFGMETVHHVHADDVAQAFQKALDHRGVAVGESFHVVSPGAVTLRGFADEAASWFGREARLRFLPWDEWKATGGEAQSRATWDHIAHSPHCSIDKAKRLLGYSPRYTSFQAVREAVEWLVAHGQVRTR